MTPATDPILATFPFAAMSIGASFCVSRTPPKTLISNTLRMFSIVRSSTGTVKLMPLYLQVSEMIPRTTLKIGSVWKTERRTYALLIRISSFPSTMRLHRTSCSAWMLSADVTSCSMAMTPSLRSVFLASSERTVPKTWKPWRRNSRASSCPMPPGVHLFNFSVSAVLVLEKVVRSCAMESKTRHTRWPRLSFAEYSSCCHVPHSRYLEY